MKLFRFTFPTLGFGKYFICKHVYIRFLAQVDFPAEAIVCPIHHPFVSTEINCYCCCLYNVDPVIDFGCIYAEPFGPRNSNPEGVQLMKADDNHVDKSESITFNESKL